MADGFTVFQGDAGESMEYFRTLKFNVPRRCNPADFFMKVLSIKYPKQADDEEKLTHLNNAYRFQIDKRIQVDNQLIKLDPPEDWAAGEPAYKASMQIQIQ